MNVQVATPSEERERDGHLQSQTRILNWGKPRDVSRWPGISVHALGINVSIPSGVWRYYLGLSRKD